MDSTFHKLVESKRNNKAECNQSHLHHEQKFVDICTVGEANV